MRELRVKKLAAAYCREAGEGCTLRAVEVLRSFNLGRVDWREVARDIAVSIWRHHGVEIGPYEEVTDRLTALVETWISEADDRTLAEWIKGGCVAQDAA